MRGTEPPEYCEDYADYYNGNNRPISKGFEVANSKASPRSSINAQMKTKKKSNAPTQQ